MRGTLVETAAPRLARLADELARSLKRALEDGTVEARVIDAHRVRVDVPGWERLLPPGTVPQVHLASGEQQTTTMMHDLSKEDGPREYEFVLGFLGSLKPGQSPTEAALQVLGSDLEYGTLRTQVFHELGHLAPLVKRPNRINMSMFKPEEPNELEADAYEVEAFEQFYGKYAEDPQGFKEAWPSFPQFLNFVTKMLTDKSYVRKNAKGGRRLAKIAWSVYQDLAG